MEKLFNEEVANQIKELLQAAKKEITIRLFTKEGECQTCKETKQLLTETAELNSLIKLEFKDIDKDKDLAKEYNITMVPSFVILNDKQEYTGVKFNGIPAGHEINSFLSAILEMAGLEFGYSEDILKRIKAIDKKTNIKVFVTLSCPHCPGAVQTAHRLAMLNPNIEAEMIEAQTFPELSMKYNVSGVPKIIINEDQELLGNQPVEAFLNTLEKL